MSWLNRLKILFCMQIFFRSSGAIVSNEVNSTSMTLDEFKSFMETAYASIRECELVELRVSPRFMIFGQIAVNLTFDGARAFPGVTLYAVGDDDLISPTRTSIWASSFKQSAYQNIAYTPTPEIFDLIGDLEMLQNVEEGSAITRFTDSDDRENFVGVLKHNYTVKTVFDEKLYISICTNDEVPLDYAHRHTYERNDAISARSLPRSKRQSTNSTAVPDVVHPKLLIIPDFSLVERYANTRDLMIQLIAQLNCVDMMFRQLEDPEVHLNIAAIILPSDNRTTPYITYDPDVYNRVYGESAVYNAATDFREEIHRFPHSKWDAILMLTPYTIHFNNVDTGGKTTVNGFSQPGGGCLGSAAIARLNERVESIYNIAHEIANLFRKKPRESRIRTVTCNDLDVHPMVVHSEAPAKLEWSNCTRTALQTYFRSDEGNCTHVQVPSVLEEVKSFPRTWITREGQCDNQQKDFKKLCRWELVSGCIVYGCGSEDTCVFSPHPPLNGSLSLHDNALQACINGTPA